jgi:hypothetical protein
MKTWCYSLAMGVVVLACAQSTWSYEVNNHSAMSREALLKTTLAIDKGSNGKLFRLGLRQLEVNASTQVFPRPPGAVLNTPLRDLCWQTPGGGNEAPSDSADLTLEQLVRFGSCFEDSTDNGYRVFGHFYDPQNGGRGLTVGVGVGPASPAWTLNGTSTSGPLGTGHNDFTWRQTRIAFYLALTGGAGTDAVADDGFRRAQWGRTFMGLGHMIHHLQDMAQPQHTRNDQHCDSCGPASRPSAYEYWAADSSRGDNVALYVRGLASSASQTYTFLQPRGFWDSWSGAGYAAASDGMAAYTSTNYVSAGTDYVAKFALNVRGVEPQSTPRYPLPQPTPAPSGTGIFSELLAGASPSVAQELRALCPNVSWCKMYFYGSTREPRARKSALSIFDPDLKALANGAPLVDLETQQTYAARGLFAQNRLTYREALNDLIPKVAGYSAGMVNYFFRGEMRIDPPDHSVYAVLDHALEKNAGQHGFREVTLKLTNLTGIASAPVTAAAAAAAVSPEAMSGEFRAVAKFRRNTCYTPELTRQIGMPGIGASCRSALDEIVVSEPITESLAAGQTKVMSFTFTKPIPIESTDLILQVVFNGQLGAEEDAVAVTSKDVSEPSFFGYANMLDIRLCPQSRTSPTSCTFITDPRNPHRASEYLIKPKTQTYGVKPPPSYAGTTRNLPSLEWLSFSRVQPALKVAQMPEGGLKLGEYARLGVIGDVQQPEGSWPIAGLEAKQFFVLPTNQGDTFPDTPFYRGIAKLGRSELPFGYLSMCSQVPHTTLGVSEVWVEFSRMRLVEVQANEKGELDPLKFPQYYRLRGATLGQRLDPANDPFDLGFKAAYHLDGTIDSTSQIRFEETALYRLSDELKDPSKGTAPDLKLVPMKRVGFNDKTLNLIPTIPSVETLERCSAMPVRHGRAYYSGLSWAWYVQDAQYLRIREWGD